MECERVTSTMRTSDGWWGILLAMANFVVSAIGSDEPGIVAAITKALASTGCNVLDSQMGLLNGAFAIMLALSAPADVDEHYLMELLAPATRSLELAVVVRRFVPVEPPEVVNVRAVISIQGADRLGIVSQIAQTLAEHSCNIVDLRTHRYQSEAGPGYLMNLEVDLPAGTSVDMVRDALSATSASLGVHCVVEESDIEAL
ncbi:MAG: glycine cleavage system protein R [Acidimicrobiales bacterium]